MGHPSPRPAAPASPSPEPASSSGLRLKDLARQPPAPFVLGRFLVVDEIGRGGMASVHLGRMDGPGGFQRWVAIKRIHPHLARNEQFVDMFLDEARTAAGISHANVAQVFELGKDDDSYWLAMEYLHGEPLREVLRRAEVLRWRLHPALAARICADAAAGLHAAHELRRKDGSPLGVVHRDVSPHNLFITYDGHTKVVDFGIAKGADRLSMETGAGILKGKLAYLSPEQASGGVVDRTTDVFALGIVLWEMTTGRRLFRSDTDLETLMKVMDGVVPRPSTIVPGYPPELEACVMKALARSKPDRYPTARDFARGLEQYLVRSGQLVGVEEVAQLLRGLFADRIETRAAHLAWAAEVTMTGRVGASRAARWLPVVVAERPAPEARPEVGQAALSLRDEDEDEDEDVPTTITTRALSEGDLAFAPRPAAGLPPPRPVAASSHATHVASCAGCGPGFAPPALRFGAPVEDLGATVALSVSVAAAPSPTFRQHARPGPVAPLAPALAPPSLQLAPPPPALALPARSSRRGRVALVLGLVLIAMLGTLAVGALAVAARRAPATLTAPAR
jgi:serine/threonine-protein kinase